MKSIKNMFYVLSGIQGISILLSSGFGPRYTNIRDNTSPLQPSLPLSTFCSLFGFLWNIYLPVNLQFYQKLAKVRAEPLRNILDALFRKLCSSQRCCQSNTSCSSESKRVNNLWSDKATQTQDILWNDTGLQRSPHYATIWVLFGFGSWFWKDGWVVYSGVWASAGVHNLRSCLSTADKYQSMMESLLCIEWRSWWGSWSKFEKLNASLVVRIRNWYARSLFFWACFSQASSLFPRTPDQLLITLVVRHLRRHNFSFEPASIWHK